MQHMEEKQEERYGIGILDGAALSLNLHLWVFMVAANYYQLSKLIDIITLLSRTS